MRVYLRNPNIYTVYIDWNMGPKTFFVGAYVAILCTKYHAINQIEISICFQLLYFRKKVTNKNIFKFELSFLFLQIFMLIYHFVTCYLQIDSQNVLSEM